MRALFTEVGVRFGDSHNKNYSISGSTLVSLYLRKYHTYMQGLYRFYRA